ncbi:dihydroneopterin aldolase [Candidatus Ishikawella capsulata]|uniref:7,8-dihydroneopterin aldolase n=1 Tax=Candidatus Ishikawaella capsulata Mpkobe TaxID=476281 RepID=C5WDK7_9ENTR|nr:dihydroneopterin aldolase [Candidatus Ishikawaella capsulata]BAH83413.1 bifunctional dihydroneopterin aldolase/dihydroneopterin triphosphate 2'-epimerase [Candidatus Ishikawaella capsulata Mpkobe]
MDVIFIKNLTLFTKVGIYEWEQQVKQKLVLNIEMLYDNTNILVDNFLNYTEISTMIVEYIESKNFTLIEYVAEETANLIMNHFPVKGIYIEVIKINAIAQAKQVGIRIKRGITFN